MTNPVVLFFVVLTGLSVGSFLNVLADRLPVGMSVVHPPSRCPGCGRQVAPLDLTPLLSYLWLRGRCRYCGWRIPVRVPIVEAATGAIFGLVVARAGLSIESLSLLTSTSAFTVIAVVDLETHRILNSVLFPSVIVAFLLFPFGFGAESEVWEGYFRAAVGGIAGFAILLAIYLAAMLAKSDLGAGDVKLAALMGVAVGFPDIVSAVLLAFVSGGVVAVFLIAAKRRSRKAAMPFGPFLAGASVVALLTEGSLWQWYWGLLT